jgi:hypothetical protein
MPIAVWKAIMLGFDLNLWDYLTFLVIVALLVAFLVIAVFVLGLPGGSPSPVSIRMPRR